MHAAVRRGGRGWPLGCRRRGVQRLLAPAVRVASALHDERCIVGVFGLHGAYGRDCADAWRQDVGMVRASLFSDSRRDCAGRRDGGAREHVRGMRCAPDGPDAGFHHEHRRTGFLRMLVAAGGASAGGPAYGRRRGVPQLFVLDGGGASGERHAHRSTRVPGLLESVGAHIAART